MEQTLKVIFEHVVVGWQGIASLFILYLFYKTAGEWKSSWRARANGLKKHNPSPEIHAAIDSAVDPLHAEVRSMRKDFTLISKDISDVAQRVARIEGHLNL